MIKNDMDKKITLNPSFLDTNFTKNIFPKFFVTKKD